MIGFFVTGSDTNAGKTCLSRALLMAGRDQGLQAIGYKPIESGCEPHPQGPDTRALALAAGCQPACTYALAEPISPSLAAAHQGITIQLQEIQAHYERLCPGAQLMIVEGAGGFLAPISNHETIADLASLLALPVLIVAGDKLGSINHSLLTMEAVERRGLRIAGIVLSALAPNSSSASLGNREQLRAMTRYPTYELPWCTSDDDLRAAGQVILGALLADAKT